MRVALLGSTALVAAVAIVPLPVAAQQYWDGNGLQNDGAVDGGSGTWNAGDANWTDIGGNANGTWASGVGVFSSTGGTVTVSGPQDFTGLRFTVDGYEVSGDALRIGGSPSSIEVTTGNTAVIGSAIQDGGGSSLEKIGLGTLVLTGTNSYGGSTSISGGTIQVGNGGGSGSLGGGAVILGGTGRLVLDRTGTPTLSNAIGGSAGTVEVRRSATLGGDLVGGISVLATNGATLTITGATTTYTGGTRVDNGATVSIDGSGALGSGFVTLDGGTLRATDALTLANAIEATPANGTIDNGVNTITLNGALSGDGTLTLSGNGQTNLGGNSTMTTSGRLVVDTRVDLVAGRSLSVGTLTINNGRELNVGAGATLTGTGSTMDIAGTLNVAAGGTVTDATAINVQGPGEIVFAGGGTLGAPTTAIAAGGTIRLNGTGGGGAVTVSGDVTGAGTFALADGATFRSGSATQSVAAGMQLAGSATIDNDGNALTISGVISGGSGAPTFTGTGTTTLTASNSYGGDTTVAAGVLDIRNGGALGGTGAGTEVQTGAALELRGNISVGNEALTLQGTGIGGGGALRNVSGGNTWSGDVTLAGAGVVRIGSDAGVLVLAGDVASGPGQPLFLGGAGDIAVTGRIGNTLGPITKDGTGRLTLSGSNTFGGNLNVNAGVVRATTNGALGSAGGGTIVADGAALEVSGNSTIGEPIFIDGDGVANGGALRNVFDANAITGTVTLSDAARIAADAGTLTIANVAGTNRNLTIGGGGTLSIGTVTTGTGTLTKVGAGTATLTGNSTYTGATTVDGGTLVVSGRIGSATVTANNAASVSVDGAALDDGAAVRLNGTSNLTLTGSETIGSLSGAAGSTVTLGTNAMTLAGATTETFSGTFTGTGGLVRAGTGTTILTGANAGYTGPVSVQGGFLRVEGTLGGTVTAAGGRIEGSGTVGGLVLGAGAVHAPGSSIGTQTVGTLTYAPGATLVIEVNDGGAVAGVNNDLVAVSGTADLGGATLSVVPENGTDDGRSYATLTRYTILTAANGVTGTFGTVTDAFAFLDPLVEYGPNAVFLTLQRNDVAFGAVGTTPNQVAAGAGLAGLGQGSPLYAAFVRLPAAAVPAALDALSGEIHASATSALMEQAGLVRGVLLRQMARSTRDGGGVALWGRAFGARGSLDARAGIAGLTHDAGGVLAGLDAPLGDVWRIGAYAGASRSTIDMRARASSGDADAYHLGAYAGARLGALRLDLGVAHAWHTLDTRRSVTFPGFSETLGADYDARTLQVFAEAGYRFARGPFALEPFAGLAHVRVARDPIAETGGAAALSLAQATRETTFATVGLRAFHDFAWGGARATVSAGAAWRHAFGDRLPTIEPRFAGGAPFTVRGAGLEEDVAVLDAGLDVAIGERMTLGLSWEGTLGARTTSHAANLRLQVAF